jgi:hypothetical protein
MQPNRTPKPRNGSRDCPTDVHVACGHLGCLEQARWSATEALALCTTHALAAGILSPVMQRSLARKAQRAAAAAQARGYTLAVRLGSSEYGNPQPELLIEGLKLVHRRAIRAAFHSLAAAVETWSIGSDAGWGVNIAHDQEYAGRVYLELADATTEEAEHGMRVLRAVLAHIEKSEASK